MTCQRHKYRPFGQILYCTRCADLQPIFGAAQQSAPDILTSTDSPNGVQEPSPESGPTSQELDAHIMRLRQEAGLIDSPLGQRKPYPPVESDFEPEPQKARVDTGFGTDMYNDSLPGEGV